MWLVMGPLGMILLQARTNLLVLSLGFSSSDASTYGLVKVCVSFTELVVVRIPSGILLLFWFTGTYFQGSFLFSVYFLLFEGRIFAPSSFSGFAFQVLSVPLFTKNRSPGPLWILFLSSLCSRGQE